MNIQVLLVLEMNSNYLTSYPEDLKKFEKKYEKAKISDYEKIIKKRNDRLRKAELKKNILKGVAVSFVISLLVVGNLYIRTEIDDINKSIRKAEKEITQLKSEENSLKMKIESLYSYESLWKEAEKLGMQKKSEAQIYYINTSSNPYVEIIDGKRKK